MSVEIKGSKLEVDVVVEDPAILAAFKAASETGRNLEDYHSVLLSIGAQAATLSSNTAGAEKIEASLAHAKTAIEAVGESVEKTVDARIRAVTAEDGELAKNIDGALRDFRGNLENLIAGEDAPVRQAIMKSLKESQDKIREDMSRQVKDQREELVKLLNPTDPTSPLREIVTKIETVASAVSEVRLAQQQAEMEAAKISALETGTFGGLDYEAIAVNSVQQIASLAGDDCLPTGSRVGNIPRSKVGDAVVELKRGAAVFSRMVVECKNQAMSKSEWEKECDLARRNRAAVGFIGLCKHQSHMPNGHRFMVLAPDKIVVAFNPEEEAPDLLVMVYQLVKMVSMSHAGELDEISIADVNANIDEALRSMEKFESLNRNAKTIENAAVKIQAEAKEIRDGVKANLQSIQAAILRGTEPPALESAVALEIEGDETDNDSTNG